MLIARWDAPRHVRDGDDVGLRAVRKRCEAIARTVEVPTPFDLDELIARLSADRGRPISVLPFPLPPEAPCGLCIATDGADYIVVTDAATGTQRDHIALHELAHLLLDHRLQALCDDDASRRLLPHLDPVVVRRMFARTSYSSLQEQEAEMLASLLRQRSGFWTPRQAAAPGGAADDVVERLGRSLDHGRHG
jgi:hypothetical protein